MFIDSNLKRVNIETIRTDADGATHARRLTLTELAALGITEIADPAPPADFSDKLYYRNEQDTAPYVVFTRKSQAQIDAATYTEGMAQIKALEQAELMPRTLREFLLEQPGAAQKPWFAKVNKLHVDIETIKASLPPAPPALP